MNYLPRIIPRLLLTVTILASLEALQSSDNWPQFRGPEGRSVAEGERIPGSFGPDENVKWKTALPAGHSSPVVWGDRIFLTAYEDLKLQMICLSVSDGSILWQIERSIDELQRYSHKDSSPSVPTPCTDGEQVAFLFGDYGLIVTDMDGGLIWELNFLPSSSEFGYGASPVLFDGKLLINCDGGIRTGLICFDFKSGEEIWFAERPETIVSYSSPYVWKNNEKTEVLQAGSSRLSSYDLENGNLLWFAGNLPGFVCPTPVAGGNRVFFGAWTTAHVTGSTRIQSIFPEELELTTEQITNPEAFYARFDANKDRKLSLDEMPPSRARDAFNFIDNNQTGVLEFEEFAPAFAENAGGLRGRNVLVSVEAGGRGDITESHVRWQTRKALPYVASPLLYQNRLYYVKKGGYITCVNPKSGEPYFESEKLGVSGEYYASPIGVNGKVLVASQGGVITLLKASETFEITGKIEMNEAILSSPAIANDTLYVRTENNLWAFRE